MLGHATIAITLDTYSHVLPNMQESAAKAMEDALSYFDLSSVLQGFLEYRRSGSNRHGAFAPPDFTNAGRYFGVGNALP
jgi:hypothetical protein